MRHYLDHNAPSPVRPEVIDVVTEAMRRDGNPLSVHEEGRRAHKVLEDAREQVRSLVNAPVNGVVFTSGGTESIHYVLHGLVGAQKIEKIFISAIEHPAVKANAETTGVATEVFPINSAGVVDLDQLREQLRTHKESGGGKFLTCVMFANNETGAIQPWLAEIVPTVENGGITEDLKQVTWKLKPGLLWSDGTPFTSADAKFTYEYCTHPEGGCAQITKFEGVESVETPDDLTVVVTFAESTPI